MMNKLDSFDSQISYFNGGVLKFFPNASEKDISLTEEQLGFQLSPQYKEFVRKYNGGWIIEVSLIGIQSKDKRLIPEYMDIVEVNIEHLTHEWWPKSWLELGTDGFGNYYVADINKPDKNGEYSILFVDHESLGLEITTEQFAPSYFLFLEKVVDEMIQLYTPDLQLKALINKKSSEE